MRSIVTGALALSIWCGAASAAVVEVVGFGQQGWRSDDTRDALGANLVGINYTNAPKPGQTPTAADDTAIAQQIQFVPGPAGSTYGGAVSIDGTSSNSGKSNFSVVDTVSGFGAAGDLLNTFAATYEWQGSGPPLFTSRTLGFKLGIQSTDWAASQASFTAQRSGESAWDLVLVHVPASSDGVWSTVSVDHDSGNWNLFRQAGNVFFPAPDTTAKTLDAWATDTTFGSKLFGSGARVTSVQFGLGSGQRNSISYVDYLQTNLLNGGDVLNFNVPEPGSFALLSLLGAAAIGRRRRAA
jgi:hypothetical protein